MASNNTYKLDKEEQQIAEAFEKGELRSNLKGYWELDELVKAAQNSLKKNRRLNIRLSEVDLLKIKARAHEIGVPYQTLIGAVLHQYANGDLAASM